MLYRFDKERLEYVEIKALKWIIVAILSTIILVLLSSFISSKKVETRYVETEVHLTTDDSFSKKALIEEIKRLPFKYPEIVYAQCVMESGNFKSPLFRQCNNLLGLREARQRITTAKGTELKHAYFDSWKDCLLDRLLFEAKYMNDLSRDEYYKYLDATYAEGSGYSDKLKQITKKWQ